MGKLFNIAANYSFIDCLAMGCKSRLDNNSVNIAKAQIYLPNSRACKSLKLAFLNSAESGACIIPNITPIGSQDTNDEFDFNGNADLLLNKSPLSLLEQKLLLTEIIKKWQKDNLSLYQSSQLASALGTLLAETQRDQLDAKNIVNIVPDELSEHWQKTLDFLSIILESWPQILEKINKLDPTEYRNQLIKKIIATYQLIPPKNPIIIAGSTGSILSTKELMKEVLQLPNGYVILPGLDKNLDHETWKCMDESHPQYGFKELLQYLQIDRHEVMNWHEDEILKKSSRDKLITELMRPAETSDKWSDLNDFSEEEVKGISVIECKNIKQEAATIAVALRECLEEKNKKAAVITNNRILARNIYAMLKKWNITIDDSAGLPLGNTSTSIFFRLLSKLISSDFSPVYFIACLKHPLFRFGLSKKEQKQISSYLEKEVYRGIVIDKDIFKISKHVTNDRVIEFLNNLLNESKSLLELYKNKYVNFDELLNAHLELFKKAILDENGEEIISASQEASQFINWITKLQNYSHTLKSINARDYSDLIDSLMKENTYIAETFTSNRIEILSPMEARTEKFDLVILAGLNEDSWPNKSKIDPWMSRPMRANFGLASNERKTGLSAHDFTQALCNNEVIITRSLKDDGSNTVPSRWLLRLKTIFSLTYNSESLKPNKPWLEWANTIYQSASKTSIEPPAPKPTKDYRPKKFSVTGIEKLMRDPYSIYASKILKLMPLDELDKEPGVAEFGNVIHDIIDDFLKQCPDHSHDEWLGVMVSIGEKHFLKYKNNKTVFSLWWPRFIEIAAWFINYEIENSQSSEKIFSEIWGQIEFDIGNETFQIKAKADRVQTNHDGSSKIVDYKTGSIPSKTDVKLGYSPQMTLEALILRENGFKNLAPAENSIDAEYWKLSGGNPAGEIINILDRNTKIDELIEDSKQGVFNLLKTFHNENTAYLSCPDQDKKPKYNDYEHLARVKEWNNS